MWFHLKIVFRDGEGIWTHDFGFWIPTTANLPRNLHIEIDCTFNPNTLNFAMESRITRRENEDNLILAEPENV